MGDRRSDGIDELRQLLPLPKRQVEVVCVEPSSETKGHKADSDKIKVTLTLLYLPVVYSLTL